VIWLLYGVALCVAGGLLRFALSAYSEAVAPPDADHLYAQMKRLWASPVIRVKVSR